MRFIPEQALVALEAAANPSDHLADAQAALEFASAAEESFAEAQRKVRCFDDAASVLEKAEVTVDEAETAMRSGTVSTAGRVAFQEALKRYEDSLTAAAATDAGADAFLDACNRAFSSSREVERAATRARRQVRARTERRRRELARLDRPAAALVALDLSELMELGGEVPMRAVAAVRDALSAIRAAREEVTERRSQEQEEHEETTLAERVERAVQAAATAERTFREARYRMRRAAHWRQELARPEAALARTRKDVLALPGAQLISELCSVAAFEADEALRNAKDAVAAVAGGGKAGDDVDSLIEVARAKVDDAQRDAVEQVRSCVLKYFLDFGACLQVWHNQE